MKAHMQVTEQILRFIRIYRKKKYPSRPAYFRTVSQGTSNTLETQFNEITSGNEWEPVFGISMNDSSNAESLLRPEDPRLEEVGSK
mmetsp:Transcript_31320/g.73755  ORF Transcript_31320/g.73755 Transcript_31320/m.73755 type:complete len:86 (-) Transcript_31320:544-801(-)